MAISKHTENFVLGAGKLFFAELRADGKYEGERYLGDSPAFSVTVETEKSERYDSDGATREKVGEVATGITRRGAVTLGDVSAENLAMFVGGETETVTQTTTPVTGESVGEGLALVGDRVYPLGSTTANPTGVRNIGSVAIKDATPTTFVAGTDYELDAAAGIIRVIPGSSLVGKTGVTADYTPVANTRTRVKTSNVATKTGRLVYRADNSSGTNSDLFAPKAVLKPSGDLAMKSRDAWMEFAFDVEFLKQANGDPALYIDGRPV